MNESLFLRLPIVRVVTVYETILKQPNLGALWDPFGPLAQYWRNLLDANGIIEPDGECALTNASYKGPGTAAGTENQYRDVFDTEFTQPAIRKHTNPVM